MWGALSPVTRIFIRRGEDTEGRREEEHMKAMWLQASGHQGLREGWHCGKENPPAGRRPQLGVVGGKIYYKRDRLLTSEFLGFLSSSAGRSLQYEETWV